jgi:hypothetical protein
MLNFKSYNNVCENRWYKFYVATLTLGLQPRQGLAKVRAKSVGECENGHSHSQVNSHFGSWSPGGLSNLQRVIARVKTHFIKELFISLKRYWNVDV